LVVLDTHCTREKSFTTISVRNRIKLPRAALRRFHCEPCLAGRADEPAKDPHAVTPEFGEFAGELIACLSARP
jgi:hypothetical protein